MQKSNRTFYVLSNSLRPTYGRKGKAWWLDVNTNREDYRKLFLGEPLTGGEYLEGVVEDNSRREDFPMTNNGTYVVSSKAKEVIEQVAPGNCRFIPLPLVFQGERLADEYWLLNCVCYLDRGVIDAAASLPWKIDSDREHPEYIRVELDAAKVPASARIFLVQGKSTYPFIREEVRLAFLSAKLSGWTAWEG